MTTPGWYPDPLGGSGSRYWNGTQWDGATGAAPVEFPEEEETALDEPKPNRSRWVVPALLVVVGVLVGVLLAVLWPEPRKSEPAASPATSPQAPTISPAEVAAAHVKISMQQKLDTDPDLSRYDLKVVDVVLVNKSGNEYKGIATVKTKDGTKHDVPVDVTSDKDNTIWDAPPGAFLFVHDDEPPAAPPPPPRAADPSPVPLDPGEGFRVCPSGVTGVVSDDTSCAFADNVRIAWYSSPGNIIRAYSPVSHLSYTMQCTQTMTTVWPEAKRCVGVNPHGVMLIVYID